MAGKGSAPGERRGGRKPGTPNKSKEPMLKALAAGMTPLEYLTQVMRTDESAEMRLKAAIAAAPYVHPKLANVEVGNLNNKPFEIVAATKDMGVL